MPTKTQEIERLAQQVVNKITAEKRNPVSMNEQELLKLIEQELYHVIDNTSTRALEIIDKNQKALNFYVFVLTTILTLFFIGIAITCICAIWYEVKNFPTFIGLGVTVIGALATFSYRLQSYFFSILDDNT